MLSREGAGWGVRNWLSSSGKRDKWVGGIPTEGILVGLLEGGTVLLVGSGCIHTQSCYERGAWDVSLSWAAGSDLFVRLFWRTGHKISTYIGILGLISPIWTTDMLLFVYREAVLCQLLAPLRFPGWVDNVLQLSMVNTPLHHGGDQHGCTYFKYRPSRSLPGHFPRQEAPWKL